MTKQLAVYLTVLATCGAPAWSQAPVPQGDDFQVNTYTTDTQIRSKVALSSDGSFVVVWESKGQDGADWGVHSQRFDPIGGPLGDEFQVNSFTTGEQRWPAVASDSTGNFVVLWSSQGQDGDASSVQGRRYDSDGMALATEFQVNTYTSGNQAQAAVASAANGSFVATWSSYRQDGLGWSVQAQRYDLDGMPQADEFQVNTYTQTHQHYPAIATDPVGNFVVVWQSSTQDGDGNSVQGQRYDSDGMLLGTEFQVNTYTSFHQKFPDVAMSENGSFVVVWKSQYQDGSEYGIHGQRYDSSGALVGVEFQVNTYTTGLQVDPAVAALAGGSFMVGWTGPGPDMSFQKTQARWFDSTGTAPDPESRVDTFDTGGRSNAAIGAALNQDLVISWTSNPQDGSFESVHGRRYSTPIFSDGFESGDTSTWSSFTP